MPIDAPPGPFPKVYVLGLLFCRWCSVVCPCAVLLYLFCWAVPLVMTLDAPPGPSSRVCVLGLLFYRGYHVVCPSAVLLNPFGLGCAPVDGS